MKLIKSKKKLEVQVQNLLAQTDRTLETIMQSGESSDQMLARLGISRQQAFDAVLADDEVEACREDLRAAMLAQPWRIYGDGLPEEQNDRLWITVRRWLPVLAEVVLAAKLNGYAVAHYTYTQHEDGYLDIAKIYNRQGSLDNFTPKPNGELHFDYKPVNTQVQFLFLVNRPTDTQPAGEMTAARLYPAVCVRKQGFVYAAQFITRYAQPYLVVKNDSTTETEHQSFAQRLYALINGGAMSLSREDEIQMLQNSADGTAFKQLENLSNARIQKMLLGKVRTADLESGSRAAQETEEKTRGDRIDGYLHLLTQAVQHLVDALVLVNAAYGKTINAPKGVWFEFNQEEQVDVKRAQRDKLYLDAGGIRLTEAYYRDVLGFAEDHFELVQPADGGAHKLAMRLSGSLNAPSAPPTAEQIIMQPKIQAVLSALDGCQSYAEFEQKLSKLDLSAGDNLLIQRLVGDGTAAWLRGAEGSGNGT